VERGALVNVPGKAAGAETKEEFGDGELRVRFEMSDLDYLDFQMRKGRSGRAVVIFRRKMTDAMEGRPHEIRFTMEGDEISATLDGQAVEVHKAGRPRKGFMSLYAKPYGKGYFRILSIDYRP
jgi:hypothetical protein